MAAAPGGAAGAPAPSFLSTGQLSPAEFEAAAEEFCRWWPAAAARGAAGPAAAAAASAAVPAIQPAAWDLVRQREPLTGEEHAYLAAEVLLHAAPAPAPAAAAEAAAHPTAASAVDAGDAAAPFAPALRGGDGDDDGGSSGSIPSLDIGSEDAGAADAAAVRVGDASFLIPASGGGGGGGGGVAAPAPHALDVHIAYHEAYRAPLLLLRARPPRGAAPAPQLPHSALLRLLAGPLAAHADASVPDWAYVAQVTHPTLGQPWAALHPCQTAELMRLLMAEGGDGGAACGRGCKGLQGAAAGAAAAEATDDLAASPPLEPAAARERRLLLRYLAAWYGAVCRAVGLRAPPPPQALPPRPRAAAERS
ncbi:hypothetical protein Rsub_12375 [Raphidocelis subcapitata]|uniref:Ubiquitin-like-conjugating enzyme ATG10 n=1 Tax=Raphidocelis subcapitata TaxID=307507 RepID=A0A2V0PIQ2_9CHLO|nr:hypothetical protein Rsub_12375 [Raphidocelis subcapitata]|eukprot:GBF99681.1 hypothetical protein Rsub_12375 [Raphidocelis subcapitata]